MFSVLGAFVMAAALREPAVDTGAAGAICPRARALVIAPEERLQHLIAKCAFDRARKGRTPSIQFGCDSSKAFCLYVYSSTSPAMENLSVKVAFDNNAEGDESKIGYFRSASLAPADGCKVDLLDGRDIQLTSCGKVIVTNIVADDDPFHNPAEYVFNEEQKPSIMPVHLIANVSCNYKIGPINHDDPNSTVSSAWPVVFSNAGFYDNRIRSPDLSGVSFTVPAPSLIPGQIEACHYFILNFISEKTRWRQPLDPLIINKP
jgi:hypothetical protein